MSSAQYYIVESVNMTGEINEPSAISY